MKKVELHLHLDGSVRESTVAELLGVNEKDIENYPDWNGGEKSMNAQTLSKGIYLSISTFYIFLTFSLFLCFFEVYKKNA